MKHNSAFIIQISVKTMLMGLYKLLYSFVGWNFLDMEQIGPGSRKYGHWNWEG